MKITVSNEYELELREVFNQIKLVSANGEEFYICMRDSGFEFTYQGEKYFAKKGYIGSFQHGVYENNLNKK